MLSWIEQSRNCIHRHPYDPTTETIDYCDIMPGFNPHCNKTECSILLERNKVRKELYEYWIPRNKKEIIEALMRYSERENKEWKITHLKDKPYKKLLAIYHKTKGDE